MGNSTLSCSFPSGMYKNITLSTHSKYYTWNHQFWYNNSPVRGRSLHKQYFFGRTVIKGVSDTGRKPVDVSAPKTPLLLHLTHIIKIVNSNDK